MFMRDAMRALGGGVLALAALLSACGGGGGGGSEAPAPVPGPPTGTTGTGLVPAAPAAGQVLVADSAGLRPLAAGLSWRYRQFTPLVGPAENTISMTQGTAGRFIENDNGDETELSRHAEGQTLGSFALPVGGARPVTISGPELLRELRAGQQFTVFDARVEGIDIALWRVVVGFEDIVVPASPRAVRALRIDDRGALRSGSGGAAQVSQLYGSSWYVPDVGVVRSVVWTSAAQVATESDERLIGFDGGSRGFGVVNTPAVALLSRRAQLDDGYIAVEGYQTVVADRRGRQLATGNLQRGTEMPQQVRLLPTSAGVRVASMPFIGATPSFNLDALDASGQLQGARLATLPVQSGDSFVQATPGAVSLVSHRSSPVIWMAFIESIAQPDSSQRDFLVVQRFDAAGQALGARQQWELREVSGRSIPQVEALPDGLLIVLRTNGVQSPERIKVLELNNSGASRIDRDYRLGDGSVAQARVVVDGAARWLAWKGSDGLPRALRLGQDGSPVGVADTVAAAQAAIVPLPAAVRPQWPFGLVAAGGRWTIPGNDFAPISDGAGGLPTVHGVLAVFDPGEGDVRNQPPAGLIRLTATDIEGSLALSFSDRTLWPLSGSAALVQWR